VLVSSVEKANEVLRTRALRSETVIVPKTPEE